jgi:adenylate cyclase
MDDRLFDEFLANTVVGGLSIALAVILVLRQRNRGDLANAGSWLFAGILVIAAPLLAGQVDSTGARAGARLLVIPFVGLYITTPFYLRYLVVTAKASDSARRFVTSSAILGSAIGTATYVLAVVFPDRFLNKFVYALDGTAALKQADFWLFGAPLLVSCLVLAVAWADLARQDLDSGERTRAMIYCIAVGPLLLSVVLPREASVVAYSTAFSLSLFGLISYWTVQGERAAFLSRFLSPQVAELVRLRGLSSVMQPQELHLSVVCIDFRGFTSYTEAIPSQAVIDLLRDYHEAIAVAVAEHDGMIKDYAGDGILILVGAPIPRDDHRQAAVALARDAENAAQRVTERWATGPHPLGIGIGIASGRVTVGAIGETAQMEYAAVGTPVNLAARLCAIAEDEAILLDERVASVLPGDAVLPRGEVELKGLSSPVTVYQLKETTAVASDTEPIAVSGEPLA